MNSQPYADKPEPYFDQARREIEPLLTAHAARVLEVGCGSGATLHWLKQSGRCGHATGIELSSAAALRARGRVDELHVGDADQIISSSALEPESFELVLCLDVLEHLPDPWAFMRQAQRLLKPGGLLVASIPNVRHARVVLPLLLLGRWRYEESGQLDRTHLRFFTRGSALELMSPSGLKVQRWQRRMAPHFSRSGCLNILSLGLFRDFLTMSFLVASRRT